MYPYVASGNYYIFSFIVLLFIKKYLVLISVVNIRLFLLLVTSLRILLSLRFGMDCSRTCYLVTGILNLTEGHFSP